MQEKLSFQSVLDKLNTLNKKLQNTKLDQTELEEYENLARQLYEMTVILNYKAKEESVYKKKTTSITEQEVVPSNKDQKESTQEEHPKATGKKEAVEFDFSNDLFAPETEDKPKQEKLAEESTSNKTEPSKPVKSTAVKQEVNQKLLEVYHEVTQNRMTYPKLASISDAIGLNDKMHYIGELFNGDGTQYDESIQQLNNFDDFEPALIALGQIATDFDWDLNKDVTIHFANIVFRRYVE